MKMVTELKKKTLLTDHHLSFLRPFILHKRKSACRRAFKEISDSRNEQLLEERHMPDKKPSDSKDADPVTVAATKSSDNCEQVCKATDEIDKRIPKREPENELPVDITKQIKDLQDRLECLKKEKHNLFQQLKIVLHDEDEKKKQEEQKLELEKNPSSGDIYDPRQQTQLQVGIGLKRPFSTILSSSYLGAPPLKRQQRGPLLPTPDRSSPSHLGRQNSGGAFHGSNETYPQESIYNPRGPSSVSSSRPPYLEQRIGTAYNIPSDIHLQGPLESPLLVRSSQPGGMMQQNPHELQPQFKGMGVSNFQYSPAPYNSMANIHSPSAPSQPVQLQFPQGGSFVQHEVLPFNQPAPHDISLKGHPYYASVAGGKPGHQATEHIPNTSFPVPLHDPRHQKLASDHSAPQSPHYSN